MHAAQRILGECLLPDPVHLFICHRLISRILNRCDGFPVNMVCTDLSQEDAVRANCCLMTMISNAVGNKSRLDCPVYKNVFHCVVRFKYFSHPTGAATGPQFPHHSGTPLQIQANRSSSLTLQTSSGGTTPAPSTPVRPSPGAYTAPSGNMSIPVFFCLLRLLLPIPVRATSGAGSAAPAPVPHTGKNKPVPMPDFRANRTPAGDPSCRNKAVYQVSA